MNEFESKIITHFENKFKKIKNKNYLALFSELEKEFKPKELIELYCYILKNKTDIKLLDSTLRQINQKKYLDTLSSLIDFILIPKQDNDFSNLKVLAIKIISNYKNKKALNALLFCLNDKNSNYKIRLASAEALGKIGDTNALEHLEKIVCDKEEKSAYIKESAVIALGLLGDDRAIDVFDSIMNTKEFFQNKFAILKERIIEAMLKLDISKNSKAQNILKASLEDSNPQIRINSIEALMNSNIRENYSLIYDRLKFDSDLEVKKNALIALYNISDSKILEEVINGEFEIELKQLAKEIFEEYEK